LKFPTTGIYAITQTNDKSSEMIINEVHTVLKAGVQVIQYRDKTATNAIYLAKALLSLCHLYQVPLIINDNIELAKEVQAAGVHLGQHDTDFTEARQLLGDHAIIGVSCYNDVDRAIAAEQHGADYVAFGRFYPSGTKPLATPAQLQTLQKAKQQIKCPIVAIGGILPENGQALLTAGADLLAVVGGLFDHDPEQAIPSYLKLFDNSLC